MTELPHRIQVGGQIVLTLPAFIHRAQWAPEDCCCPWPWPMQGDHPAQACPHHIPDTGSVVFIPAAVTEHPCPGQPRCSYPDVHHHLEHDGQAAVYSAGGRLLDPFDVPRTGVMVLPARPKRTKRRKRRR